MLISAPYFMTIDLHAADPCSRCHCSIPRITITEGAATICCSRCGYTAAPAKNPSQAVARWNREWRSAPSRALRFWRALLCVLLDHVLGKPLQMDVKGIWYRCARCKNQIIRPYPRIRRIEKKRHYASVK